MDKQEIFNTVYLGLASQGFEQSVSQTLKDGKWVPKCMYRDEEGRKCAAGWLIPDEDYDPEMDKQGIVERVDYFKNKYDEDTLTFIRELQKSHDYFKLPEKIKASLIRKANKYGLTVPEMEGI